MDTSTTSENVVGSDHFFMLAEALPLGILSADSQGRVNYANEASRRIFNRSAADLAGSGWHLSIHEEDRAEVRNVADRVLSLGLAQEVTFRVETGLFIRWAHAKFVPMGSGANPGGWIATVDDVTEDYSSQRRLTHQATHDALTGLPNRTLLDDRLHQACSRLQRGGWAVTVLFVDLDGFKEINDTHGHLVGDEVLISVAERLRATVRAVDTVARLGGDEFVVVCESVDAATVGSLVARIDAAISASMATSTGELVVRASIGHASASGPAVDPGELLSRADQAMYRNKREKREADQNTD